MKNRRVTQKLFDDFLLLKWHKMKDICRKSMILTLFSKQRITPKG